MTDRYDTQGSKLSDAELADLSFQDANRHCPLDSLNNKRLWFPWRFDEAGNKIPYRLDGKTKGWQNANGRGTRAQAEAAHARMPGKGGIGMVLGEPTETAGAILCGLDADSCLDASGTLAGWAEGVVSYLNTYTEISPSDTGLKLYFWMWNADVEAVRAKINEGNTGPAKLGKSWKYGTGKHPPALELYTGGRWFAVTGNPFRGSEERELAIVKGDTVLITLMGNSGPTLAAGKGIETTPSPSAGKPKSGKAKGRSEHAMAIGNRMKRNGASPEDIEAAILDDEIGAAWAADHDQRQIDRVIERAGLGASPEDIEAAIAAPDDETVAAWEAEYQRRMDRGIKRAGLGAKLSDMTGFGLNEDGIARIFAARFAGQLKFDHHRGCWYKWGGTYWQLQETRLAFDWVRDTCRAIRLKNAQDPAARALAKASTAEAVERMAQRDQKAFAVTSAVWDCDPWLLGTPTGTVDLRTGELRAARPEDMISRSTAVGPAGEFHPDFDCPLWLRFLDEATGGDKGMIRFLQQWVGYSLTGITTERALLFLYGPGGNGKGTFYNLIAWLLGGYQETAAIETFTAGSFDRHPTDIAALRGARFVRSSETEQGRSWAQSRIKLLTGGDPVKARFMHKNEFTYIPQFKLNFDGNHKPKLRNFGDAERDRFNIAHFDRRPAKPNPDLAEQLKYEGSEILAWAISGCLDWQQNGLIRPKAMVDATEAYFAENDHKQRWFDDHCERGDCAETNAALRESWQEFAREQGITYISQSELSDWLIEQGFEPIKDKHGIRGRGFKGLRIATIDIDYDTTEIGDEL